MAGLGASDRGGAAQGQNSTTQPGLDGVGYLLALLEWREMAISALGIRPLVDRGPAFHYLTSPSIDGLTKALFHVAGFDDGIGFFSLLLNA